MFEKTSKLTKIPLFPYLWLRKLKTEAWVRKWHAQSHTIGHIFEPRLLTLNECWLVWQELSLGVESLLIIYHWLPDTCNYTLWVMAHASWASEGWSWRLHNLSKSWNWILQHDFIWWWAGKKTWESYPWHQGFDFQRSALLSGLHNSHLWILRLTDLQDWFAHFWGVGGWVTYDQIECKHLKQNFKVRAFK